MTKTAEKSEEHRTFRLCAGNPTTVTKTLHMESLLMVSKESKNTDVPHHAGSQRARAQLGVHSFRVDGDFDTQKALFGGVH